MKFDPITTMVLDAYSTLFWAAKIAGAARVLIFREGTTGANQLLNVTDTTAAAFVTTLTGRTMST